VTKIYVVSILYAVFNVALISDNPNKLVSSRHSYIVYVIMIYTIFLKYLSNFSTFLFSIYFFEFE